MAGIYIHVPFCKSRCHYCDFFKSTKLNYRQPYIEKIYQELIDRKQFFSENDYNITSIYFGGGTPSLISINVVQNILQLIYKNYCVSNNVEITIEVNPDDLSPEYLRGLKLAGINRLSIGIQSFFNEDLTRMGRRHDADQSRKVLTWAFDSGFENVGADLIYGLPWANEDQLLKNLNILFQYPVKHLSAYHLTIEEGTQFGKEKRQNKLSELSGSASEKLFWHLHDEAEKMGFQHYEISNFCKEGSFSRHNTSYWNGSPYLGIGPGGHSFSGKKRYWNEPNLFQYIKNGYRPGLSQENLSEEDRFNETLMLRLRTKEGVSVELMKKDFSLFWNQITPNLRKWIDQGFLEIKNDYIFSTRKGWFVIDGIIEDFFIVE